MSDGPTYVTDGEAQEVIESAYELVSDSLPVDWKVTIMVTDAEGRTHCASDVEDMDDASERLRRWGRKMTERERALPPMAARH